MVVEPVGATLAVVGLLQPLFVTCRALYKGYQLTQSFGEDCDFAQRRYYIQFARLEAISQKKLGFLKNSIEPYDKDHPITKAIINQLVITQSLFRACHNVLKKYHDLGMYESKHDLDVHKLSLDLMLIFWKSRKQSNTWKTT